MYIYVYFYRYMKNKYIYICISKHIKNRNIQNILKTYQTHISKHIKEQKRKQRLL